jgi:hypothetical protein
LLLPDDNKKLLDWLLSTIEKATSSMAQRAAVARGLKTWIYTGSPDGNEAILNRLLHHQDRLASYLYSPVDLRFHIDFTHIYPKNVLDHAEVSSRILTREWERRDIDTQFGHGVLEALNYGTCIPKLLETHGGLQCKLVMPWQFAVSDETKVGLGSEEQEWLLECNYISKQALWRRVSHLPDAVKLFKRALNSAKKRSDGDGESYFHSVLLAGTPPVVKTDPPFASQPGGMVQAAASGIGGGIQPEVSEELIPIYEIWVVDDEKQDYTTLQVIEPDILITRFKRTNFFVPEYHPYGMIQPNYMHGNFWGRSEIADLMKLQHLLRDRLDDIKRMMALQYDRRYKFIGGTGPTDEDFDQMKMSGFLAANTGEDWEDITPEMPKEAFTEISEIMSLMDEVSGFQNILSGQGEPGVRAGNHAQTLLKTAAPRLRDRALLVERQCADLADKSLEAMTAKEAGSKAYWTRGDDEFLLAQLPEDRRVTVDSHSSSPIYEEDHKDMVAFLLKTGVIDGEDAINLLSNLPRKDILVDKYHAAQGTLLLVVFSNGTYTLFTGVVPDIAESFRASSGPDAFYARNILSTFTVVSQSSL